MIGRFGGTHPIEEAAAEAQSRRIVFGARIWAGASIAGAAVLALPDTGPRLISFSSDHGPSAVDLAGIVVLVAGWLAFVVPLWRARRWIRHRRSLTSVALVGTGIVIWSIAGDESVWWLLGIGLLVASQALAARSALHGPKPPPAGTRGGLRA